MRSNAEPANVGQGTPLRASTSLIGNETDAGVLLKELRSSAERAEIALADVNRMPFSLVLPSGRLLILAAGVGTLTIIMLANQLAQAIL